MPPDAGRQPAASGEEVRRGDQSARLIRHPDGGARPGPRPGGAGPLDELGLHEAGAGEAGGRRGRGSGGGRGGGVLRPPPERS